MRPSTFTLYCVEGRRADVGARAGRLALGHRLRESFGPRVNVVSLPARPDPLGRGGLTSRTIYEINLFGHGVVVCGETDTPDGPGPTLEVDATALQGLEAPLMLYGHVAADADGTGSLAGLAPAALHALADRALVAVSGDEVAASMLRRAGARSVVVGGAPCLYADRVRGDDAATWEPTGSGVLLAVRDPASLPESEAGHPEARDRVRRLVRRLREAGLDDVRLLCQTPADHAFAAAFADLDYASTDDPYAWLALLRAARLVLTWRLEPALACAAYGTPFVHLASDPGTLPALEAPALARWSVDVGGAADPVDAVAARWREALPDANDRLSVLAAWAELDRRTGAAFDRFARAVRAAREGWDLRRSPTPGPMPPLPFAPENTRIE